MARKVLIMRNPPKRKRRNEMLKNLLLLGLVTLLCLGLIEIALRLIWQKPGYGYPEGLHIPDQTKGYAYQPNFTGRFPSGPYHDIEIRINSKGLRDYEHDYGKPAGTVRILGLGDSVTFGAGIRMEDTFLKKLEKTLNEEGHPAEVINAGVNSYEFDQEYTYFLEEGYKYEPDILLVNIVLNDAAKVDVQHIRELRFGNGKLSYQNMIELARNNCYLCNFLYFNSLVIKNRLTGKGAGYNDQYFNEVYRLWEGDNWNYTRQKMAALINYSTAHHIEVVFVVFPYTQQFSHSELKWDDLPQQQLKAFGKEANITVIDLLPYLDVQNYIRLYLYNDNLHLNPAGNEAVKDVLHDELRGMILRREKQ